MPTLWLRLSNCGDPPIVLGGSDLNRLRRERNRADYDVEGTFDLGQALLQVQASRRIIQTLDTAAQQPTRTQITDAMKTYERDVLKQVTWQP